MGGLHVQLVNQGRRVVVTRPTAGEDRVDVFLKILHDGYGDYDQLKE